MPLSIPLEPWQETTGRGQNGAANDRSVPLLDKQSLITKWSASLPLNTTAYSTIEDNDGPSPDPDKENLVTTFPGWPASPQKLKRSRLVLCGEIALLVLPVGFIVLAVTAWGFNGELVSAKGKAFQRSMLFGPTLFPLAFAALGGRSMRNIALWKAQRGSTVGELERIYGSQSFVSALWLIFSLRPFNVLSVSLLSFWCLSPLGGQSSLRVLWEANSTTTHQLYYSDRDARSLLLEESPSLFTQRTSALLSTSIANANTLQNSSMDTWNHPKIPRLHQIERQSSMNKTQTQNIWIDVPAKENTIYTSLIGVSVVGLQPDTITNFTVDYEYIYLTCECRIQALGPESILDFFRPMMGNSINAPPREWPKNLFSWTPKNTTDPYKMLFNATFFAGPSFVSYTSSFFLFGTRQPQKTLDSIFYVTRDLEKRISVYQCSINSVMVEAAIICVSSACGVYQVRRSSEVRNPLGGGRPWDVITQYATSEAFFRYFSSMVGMVNATRHPIDNYIYGNLLGDYFEDTSHNWSSVDTGQISQRLTEIFNTYWDSSRWMRAASRSDPYGRLSINATTSELFQGFNMRKTNATVIRKFAVYRTSVPWVITLLFCSFLLLILGMANVVFSTFTIVPDVFGFVSSMTRGNPYVDVPGGGTTLDGTERARLIMNVKVQLGDVRDGDPVGYITLRSVASNKAARVTSVRSERLYN